MLLILVASSLIVACWYSYHTVQGILTELPKFEDRPAIDILE